MKTWLRNVLIVVFILCLSVAFAGCDKEPDDFPLVDVPEFTGFSVGDLQNFLVIHPEYCSDELFQAGKAFCSAIEAKTGVSGASWTTLGTYTLTGWSGWNDIPLSISTFGGGTSQTSNYWYMRLTFANTSVNSSYSTTKSSIIGLRLFGDTCWTRTSNMGETGHLYSYDSSQNATFPANVTATTFVGALSGNATTATTATNVAWSGVTSKPSYYDAKAIKSITRSGTTFTYTCMDGTTGTFTQQDNNTDEVVKALSDMSKPISEISVPDETPKYNPTEDRFKDVEAHVIVGDETSNTNNNE